jgi:hypothetical protein
MIAVAHGSITLAYLKTLMNLGSSSIYGEISAVQGMIGESHVSSMINNITVQNAKVALGVLRKIDISVRSAARICATNVPSIHLEAGCPDGANCTGRGCRI